MSGIAHASDNAGLPDFIIIGAMKCATSTLHEQLALQRGIFMSTPKEPNFFSDDEQWARGMAWYRGLFATSNPGDLRGESSTHYSKLPTYPRTVERMKAQLPHTVRLIYIMRHPIDRLVSQYIHEWTQRVVNGSIDEAVDAHPELIAYSRYAMQLKPFIEAWGRDRILPLFFEHYTNNQQETLERVCQFVGYRGEPRWDFTINEQNVSSERLRASAWRDAVTNLPGMKAFRRAFIPRAMRDRIKSAWKMKERPTLSDRNISRLTQVFDEDLACLGSWLGIEDLRCDTFAQLASKASPTWREAARAPAA